MAVRNEIRAVHAPLVGIHKIGGLAFGALLLVDTTETMWHKGRTRLAIPITIREIIIITKSTIPLRNTHYTMRQHHRTQLTFPVYIDKTFLLTFRTGLFICALQTV
jgi:hypothetical protein